MKSLLSVILLLLTLTSTLAFSQQYDFSAAPVKVKNLTVTGTFYLVSGTDTISSWTTATVCSTALAGDLRGTWKTRDTAYFGVLARASTWTGRQTFADLITGDSTKTVTLDATGKITGGAGLGITGAGAFSGRATATDIAVTDSAICVTLDASGAIKGATTLGVTGASTLTGGATVGSTGATAVLGIIASKSGDLDSLGLIVTGDTFWIVTH